MQTIKVGDTVNHKGDAGTVVSLNLPGKSVRVSWPGAIETWIAIEDLDACAMCGERFSAGECGCSVDLETVAKWAALIAAKDVEGMRAACAANDRNGDFEDSTGADLVHHLIGWSAELMGYEVAS